jgi:hypothetical protein
MVPLVALAVAVAAQPASGDWLKTIRPMDWTLYTANQNATTLVFGKPARGNFFNGAAPRLWIRVETARQTPRSSLALTQFDCVGRRYTVIQSTGWDGNNMEGAFTPMPPLTAEPQWEPILAGSVYDQVLTRFCPGK